MGRGEEVRFDKVLLRLVRREAYVDGHRVRLGNRAFDLLLALIDRRDRVVSKAELATILWPGSELSDGNLHVHVSTIRRVLGPGTIATIQGQGYRFVPALRETDADRAPAPAADPPGWTTTLPRADALIGREEEIRLALANLRSGRCVTVIGPGGVGKTRLAREVTAIWSARQPKPGKPVAWVDLREANDPSTCLSAIAQALRLPAPPASNGADEPSAIAWLARRSAGCSGLLVLDNAEHMQAPVAAVVDALCRMPCDLRLLVTSRHRLETADAWELTLRGLDVVSVDDGETGIGPAVWLFGSRAALADPAFRPVDMPPSVETICRRLDGLPLALELAAARVPLLGVDGVVQALDSQLSAFVDGSKRRGDRHVSLLAVLEWSASLLDRDEQALLAALAVLQGSFTLVDAASVAGFDDHWHFTACFDGLRRKSLVFAETVTPQPWRSGTPTGTTDADSHDVRRWRMLESTRQFALLRLRGSGRETAVLHRHAETFAAQAQALHQRWLDGFGPEAAIEAAMERLIGNGAAALDWCCGDGRVLDAPRAQLAARILTATARAFHHRGLLQKARRWGMAVGRFWLEDAAGPSVGAPRLSPLEEAHLRLALAILRPPGFVSSASRVAQLRRAGELLDGLDAPGLTVDVQLTFAILAARAGQPQVALDAVAAARRALPAPAPARLRACVAEAQMRLAVLQGLGSAPEDALVEEILADLEAAGDGNSRVAVYLRIEQAERLLLAGRHRAAMRALAALCDDFSGGRYGWEVWLAPFDALAHAQLRSRDMNGAAESLRRSFMMAEMSGYWGELGAVTAWYLCTRGRHRASMELHGATEAYLSSIGHAHDRLQSTALDEALTLARSACRSADITRWRAEGRARGPQGLPQMLGQGDGRFSP